MKLTVIMPVFNGAQTASRAVASVGRLSSLMDGELRMIAVDDCSTDDTHPILTALKARHPFLEVFRLPQNGGPGPARNHALDQVSEGWIGFIDADDEIIAEPYADVLRRGEYLNRDFITFNGYFISEDTVAPKYDFERIADDRRLMAKTSLRSELDGSVIFSIYHSKLVKAHDLRFGRDFYEDIVFSNLGLILAERRLILNAYCYKKHWSGASIVNTVSERHIKGLLGAIVDLRNRLLEKGLYGADLSDDFAYGAHGYVAKAVTDIVRSTNHCAAGKIRLLEFLFDEFRNCSVLCAMPRLDGSTKSRLCTRARDMAGQGGFDRAGLAELSRLIGEKV